MLRIWLLGQFEVQVEGKRTVIPARAAQSLLAFLALSAGTPHRREKLAGMLWPDFSDDIARRNLRHELWRLRKALGANQTTPAEYILSEELAIQFNRDSDYWLDVAQLERTSAPDDSVGDLIARLALYRGELLPGFYDDWVGPERDRVQALFENRMDELLRRLIAEERWLTAIEWAERWIALGHTPEAAYRALMLAHHAQGETSKIALDYERCAEALREDLDIEPSNETRALYERLTHGEIALPAQLEASPTIFVQSSGTVTFLFSDIEGSTKLLDRLGPEYASLLAEHQDLIRGLGERYNGHEIDTQGDSFFFAFFRAADAVAFAAETQRALAVHQFPQDANVRVRMGLHTGEPMLARTGYVGMDVHRAARIGAAGHGGQVLLSPTTRTLVENELPDGTTLHDLGEHKLKDLRYPVHIVQLTIEGLPSDFPPLKSINTGSEPPAPGEPPFKGLEFFDERDANLFFGREQLIEKLAREVLTNRFLAVVVGASGSGKSSVVRAGLIPALRATNDQGPRTNEEWKIFVMTPTAHPLEALATVLTRDESLTVTAQLMDDLAREPRSLHLYLRRMTIDEGWMTGQDLRRSSSIVRRDLLLVDQFEELFTLCHDDLEREQFIDNLVNALTPSSELTLVLTIRADFYSYLAAYPELRDMVAKQQEYIGPMNAEELRRAIEEPAKAGHWEFEPGLVDLILRDVGDEPGALPLLSHALLETWKRRSGHLMTLKGYHDAGGVRGAIAHTAESTYQQLSPDQQNIARNIFVRLTELGEGTEDTRRRAEIGELDPGRWDPAEVRQVLTLLADARLITTGEHTAEVAHEALIREWPRLREWLNEDREGLKLHRTLTEAAHEWEFMERDASVLYRGARLAQAREFTALNTNALNVGERAFLRASEENEKREEREREAQRERELLAAQKLAAEQQARAEESNRANKRLRQRAVFLAGVLILALLAAGAAFFFLTQSNVNLQAANEQRAEANTQRDNAQKEQAESEKQQRLATARELAANAIANLENDPEASILLALQAVDTTRKVDGTVLREAEEALHRAVQSSRILYTIPDLANPNKVAYSPDETRMAVRGRGMIWVFDTTNYQQMLALPLTPGYTDHIYFSADGKQLGTIDAPEESNIVVKTFDLQTGDVIRTIPLPIPRKEWVFAAFSPDWSRVVIAQTDGTATVWDKETGKLVRTLSGHTSGVSDVAYSPDGRRIATGDDDGIVKIWDAETGKELLTLKEKPGRLFGIIFSNDNTRIATATENKETKIWDATTGLEVLILAGHSDWVNNVVFNADGTRVATLGQDGKTILWDGNTGKQLLALASTGNNGLAINQKGTRLTTLNVDGRVKIWDLSPSHEVLTVPTGGLLSSLLWGQGTVAYTPDGKYFAVGMRDGLIKIWDASTGESHMILQGHTAGVNLVVFSRDGSLLVSASSDHTAKIWDVGTGKELITLTGHSDEVGNVAISADNRHVATTSLDSTVKVWDVRSGKLERTFTSAISSWGLSVAFSPDGTQLVTSFADGTLAGWDLATGNSIFTVTVGEGGATEIVYGPDGTTLALSGDNLPARIVDAVTGKTLVTMGKTGVTAYFIAYSPDGIRVATSYGDGTARIWDAATGQALLTLYGSPIATQSIAFSPDGTKIALASDDDIRVYLLRIDDLVSLAKTRVTRALTQDECQKYLHVEKCPQ